MSEPTPRFDQRRRLYAGCAILLAALLVRWRASLGEFWLDEIWSWFLVQLNVQSASDVVTTLRHDNNHMLNSWLIYILGPERDWTTYRLPAVLFGTATVGLAGWWGRLQGSSVGWFAMILTAGSYVLTHYSSEARGYAPLMFFSLLAYVAMDRSLATGRIKWDVIWNIAAVLGVLSHPTFVTVLVSGAIWSALFAVRKAGGVRPATMRMLRWHLVPLLFSGWIYWVNLSQLVIGGGLEQSPGNVLRETLSLTIGGPFDGGASIAAASVGALLLIGCLIWLLMTEQKMTAFVFFLIIAATPAALVAFAERTDLYVRYFLISIVFSLLLFSLALGRLVEFGGARRVAAVVLTAAFLLFNAAHIARLWNVDRGHYLTALEIMQQQTKDDRVMIGSDNDFRHRLMLTYYQRYVTMYRPMTLVDRPWPPNAPEWLLLHSFEPDWEPDATIAAAEGLRYDLVQSFPYAGLSGWSLGVYRRAED